MQQPKEALVVGNKDVSLSSCYTYTLQYLRTTSGLCIFAFQRFAPAPPGPVTSTNVPSSSTELLKAPSVKFPFDLILFHLLSCPSSSRPKTLYYLNFTSNTYIPDIKCLSGLEVQTTRGGTVQHFPFTIIERPSPCRTIADIPTTSTRSISIRVALLRKKHDQELPTLIVLDHHSEIGIHPADMIEAKVSDTK